MAEIQDKIIAEEDKLRNTRIPSLRTLKTDTAEYIKKEKMSVVDIVAKEAESGKLKPIEKTRSSKSSKIIIAVSIFVVLAAAVSVYFIFLAPKPSEKVENISYLPKSFIVAEQESEIAVLKDNNPQKFLSDIKNALANPIRPNSLLYIQIFSQDGESKNIISAKDFFKFANVSPLSGIFGYFDDRFMLAKFYLSKDSPILIFKVSSYDYAFPMMLKWERTMSVDFEDIFSLENTADIAESFEDREIQNRDARVLNDKNGVPVLFYSFINQDYLVITTSEEALTEIYRRFSSSQYING